MFFSGLGFQYIDACSFSSTNQTNQVFFGVAVTVCVNHIGSYVPLVSTQPAQLITAHVILMGKMHAGFHSKKCPRMTTVQWAWSALAVVCMPLESLALDAKHTCIIDIYIYYCNCKHTVKICKDLYNGCNLVCKRILSRI